MKILDAGFFYTGSRARGKFYKGSDFDIGFEEIDSKTFQLIRDKLIEKIDESIIPHKVDLVNFNEVSDDFKKEALRDVILWKG